MGNFIENPHPINIPSASSSDIATFVHYITSMLTFQQIQLVKATAPVFKLHGEKITTHFYKRHPDLKNIFNIAHQQTGQQPIALAHAVFAYAANIDNLGALSKSVSLIAHKHASLQIKPEQYPIVGENLIASVKEVLGDAVNDDTIDAWKVAFDQLAKIFVEVEQGLYKEAAALDGGWNGWRKFKVTKKVPESEEITSFYLEPVDKGKVPTFQPGQFISIKQFISELGYEQPRQYSLSVAPGNQFLRISVKKETGKNKPSGKMSNLLHTSTQVGSQLDVSPPFGTFVLDLKATTPVVMISGGVGLTPMISMLETLAHQSYRKAVFVHAARNFKVHAMKQYVNEVIKENPNITRSIWYGDVDGSTEGVDYDHHGTVNLEKLKNQILSNGADYYICGPLGFMTEIEKQLLELGVNKEKIHSEVYGVDTR